MMDEEVVKEEQQREFLKKKEEQEKRDRERTEKNRAKREKARLRKERAKKGGKGAEDSAREGTPLADEAGGKKKLAPRAEGKGNGETNEEEDANQGGAVKNVEEIGLVIEDDE